MSVYSSLENVAIAMVCPLNLSTNERCRRKQERTELIPFDKQ